MKIAIFHNLPPGGARRAVYEEIKGLSARHDLDLYVVDNGEEDFLNFSRLRCRIFSFPFKNSSFRPVRDFQDFFSLKSLHHHIAGLINSRNYDLALVHPDRFTQSPPLLAYLHIPSVYYCHELLRAGYESQFFPPPGSNPFKSAYDRLTLRWRVHSDLIFARHAGRILVNSLFTARAVRSAYGIKAQVCYPGVDTSIFAPQKAAHKSQLLFVAHPHPTTGYPLAQAIMSLLPPSVHLQVVDLSRRPLLSDSELARLYAASLATLCLSVNEPFGLSALESMACGTPVLAVSEGGYRETILPGRTGWLLPRDPRQFAAKIRYLLARPHRVSTLSRAARLHVAASWTWSRHVSRLESLIRHAAQS